MLHEDFHTGEDKDMNRHEFEGIQSERERTGHRTGSTARRSPAHNREVDTLYERRVLP